MSFLSYIQMAQKLINSHFYSISLIWGYGDDVNDSKFFISEF